MKKDLVALIRKLLKNKIVKIVLISLVVFLVATGIIFFLSRLIINIIFVIVNSSSILASGILIKIVLLVSAILYPLYLRETITTYDDYQKRNSKTKIKKRGNNKTTKRSDVF